MSYALAKAQIVTIIEGTTPAKSKLGLGPRFRHDPKGESVVARSFTLAQSELGRWGPVTTTTKVHVAALIAEFRYPSQVGDADALDVAMATDYELLSNALLDVSGWNQPTSTLWALASDDVVALPSSTTKSDDATTLSIQIVMRYTQ